MKTYLIETNYNVYLVSFRTGHVAKLMAENLTLAQTEEQEIVVQNLYNPYTFFVASKLVGSEEDLKYKSQLTF